MLKLVANREIIFLQNSRTAIRGVLFDLDGTLIEFKFNVGESRIAMIEWLGKNGFDTNGLSPETKTQKLFEEVRRQCSAIAGRDYSAVRQELSNILEDFEYNAFSLARPHP